MKGKITQHGPLLTEVLETEDLAQWRAASLELTLEHARRRRRRRRLQRGALTAGVAGAILFAWLAPDRHPDAPPSAPSENTLAAGPTARSIDPPKTPAKTERFKTIGDEELLELFPNRPVALIGAPGQQKLLFLDQAPSWPGL